MLIDLLRGTNSVASLTIAVHVVVVVVFVFYGPSTFFRSFRARSVILSTAFLGKPPRQFTST